MKACILKHHLVPVFGEMRLDSIRLHPIEVFKAKPAQERLGQEAREQHSRGPWENAPLRARGRVHRERAADQAAQGSAAGIRLSHVRELPRLLDAVKDDPEPRTLLLLGSDAGLRQGELVALEWGDVNLVAGTLTVRRSSWHGIVGTPKSGRDRKVPLTARLRTALRAHRHLRSELVFCHADASPLLSPQSRRRFGSPASGPGSGASAPMCFGTPSARTSPCVGRRRRRSRSRWTLRYMHLAPSALREAIGLLDLGQQVGNAQKASV